LAQFFIDVALVIVYWLTATWVEGNALEAREASAEPESILIAISFFLYILWDQVGFRMRQSERYIGRPLGRDVPARRRVSGGFFIAALVLAAVVLSSDPHTGGTVVLIDALLIVLLIAYRVFKEAVTTPESRAIEDSERQSCADDGA
jgi:hypothetical protein